MQNILLDKPVEQHDTTSRFRMVVVAALRAKQLVRGAKPRIEHDLSRRKNTSIALEEVRRQLVGFRVLPPKSKVKSNVPPLEPALVVTKPNKPAFPPL